MLPPNSSGGCESSSMEQATYNNPLPQACYTFVESCNSEKLITLLENKSAVDFYKELHDNYIKALRAKEISLAEERKVTLSAKCCSSGKTNVMARMKMCQNHINSTTSQNVKLLEEITQEETKEKHSDTSIKKVFENLRLKTRERCEANHTVFIDKIKEGVYCRIETELKAEVISLMHKEGSSSLFTIGRDDIAATREEMTLASQFEEPPSEEMLKVTCIYEVKRKSYMYKQASRDKQHVESKERIGAMEPPTGQQCGQWSSFELKTKQRINEEKLRFYARELEGLHKILADHNQNLLRFSKDGSAAKNAIDKAVEQINIFENDLHKFEKLRFGFLESTVRLISVMISRLHEGFSRGRASLAVYRHDDKRSPYVMKYTVNLEGDVYRTTSRLSHVEKNVAIEALYRIMNWHVNDVKTSEHPLNHMTWYGNGASSNICSSKRKIL